MSTLRTRRIHIYTLDRTTAFSELISFTTKRVTTVQKSTALLVILVHHSFFNRVSLVRTRQIYQRKWNSINRHEQYKIFNSCGSKCICSVKTFRVEFPL